jgi:outer membrane protein insertion porin family/translocation and assembly module TamA
LPGALLLAAVSASALAVPLDSLDVGREWLLRSLEIEGVEALDESAIRDVMVTEERAWWAIWRPYPPLDVLTLREDLSRIVALHRERGFYETAVAADAAIGEDGRTVDVTIRVEEGPAVHVDAVDVDVEGERIPRLDEVVAALPVEVGARFDEERYVEASRRLKRVYREASHARVRVERRARIDLDARTATVRYTVVPGPPSVFGAVHVVGAEQVDPDVVRAEVAFEPGQRFEEKLLERTQEQLTATRLFNVVRLEEREGTGPVVDVEVHVREAPPRDVRLGIGYDTDEGPRGIAGWRHYNFFGGGRQLGFTARISEIQMSAAADFLQPHWPTDDTRTRLLLAHVREDEDSYDVTRSSVTPRLEWRPRPELSAFVFYRLEYDELTEVETAVRRALPAAVTDETILSGLGVGVEVLAVDDPIDPTRGITATLVGEPVGLGGDVHFARVVAEVAAYRPLGFWGLLAAARVRAGVAEPIAGDDEIPLFERFYAGGVNSVRGYERRHVGPLAGGDPIGGRTLLTMSAELRRAIMGPLGAAVFVDAGQVGLESDRLPVDDLQVGVGFGVRYKSPAGPIRVDLGFPLDPPPGDQSWRIHVSLGRAF